MQQYTRLKEDAGEDDLGLLLVADAEIYRLDAVIRWLDGAEARLSACPTPRADRSPARAPRRERLRRRRSGARR